jgi:hypothetical protein
MAQEGCSFVTPRGDLPPAPVFFGGLGDALRQNCKNVTQSSPR